MLNVLPLLPSRHPAPLLRFLTDKGIEYLREYLNLPADVVPATLTKSARPAGETEAADTLTNAILSSIVQWSVLAPL